MHGMSGPVFYGGLVHGFGRVVRGLVLVITSKRLSNAI